MCSIPLNTRVKDKRNLLANLSFQFDNKYNIPFTQEDEVNKCKIFGVTNTQTDFITQQPRKGVGDHYYPLAQNFKDTGKIGSDSLWNRIPVNGYNSKYKGSLDADIKDKVDAWIAYVDLKGGKLYYQLTPDHKIIISELQDSLVKLNEAAFHSMCEIRPIE